VAQTRKVKKRFLNELELWGSGFGQRGGQEEEWGFGVFENGFGCH
jgi:hypothetical protein